jgi:hypothetical protein
MSSCSLSYLGGVFDHAAMILCGSDAVTDPVTGRIITHHYPLRFHHVETTVKGTEMGYRNFLPAKIGHWQLPQQANIDTMRQQCVVPLQSN